MYGLWTKPVIPARDARLKRAFVTMIEALEQRNMMSVSASDSIPTSGVEGSPVNLSVPLSALTQTPTGCRSFCC